MLCNRSNVSKGQVCSTLLRVTHSHFSNRTFLRGPPGVQKHYRATWTILSIKCVMLAIANSMLRGQEWVLDTTGISHSDLRMSLRELSFLQGGTSRGQEALHSVSKETHHEFIGFPCDPGSRSSDPGRVIFDDCCHGALAYLHKICETRNTKCETFLTDIFLLAKSAWYWILGYHFNSAVFQVMF